MERIGRYEVVGPLGSGGFATVYEGRDPILDARVAIKVMNASIGLDPELRMRFIQEAQLLRRFESRRLVPVYDIGELDDGRPYFVMKLATHGTLEDRLAERRSAPRTAADVERLSRELAGCLHVLHREAVIHRDVKPSNVFIEVDDSGEARESETTLLGADEYLVLADFGLARDNAAAGSFLTAAGGTSGFAAPEQLVPGGQPDERTDIYAATSLLHVAVTGEVPLPGSTVHWSLPGSAKKQLSAALTSGLASNRADRPPNVAAWRTSIGAAITERRATGSRASHKRALVVAVATTAVLAAVLLAGSMWLQSTRAGFTVETPAGAVAGEPVTLGVDARAGESYSWSTDEGATGAGSEFTFTPVVPGVREVTVVRRDSDGATTRETIDVEVMAGPDAPRIVGPDTVVVGQPEQYSVDATEATSVVWTLDGRDTVAEEFLLTPTAAGTVTFTVIVTDDDGVGAGAIKTVTILDGG